MAEPGHDPSRGAAPGPSGPPPYLVTASVWVLVWRTVSTWVVSGAPAAACCSAALLLPADFDARHVVVGARWWRSEAARGIALLEAELAR